MIAHFQTSARLQQLRVSRRCYTLLHRARIAPENLRSFYQTYRLPADPFFPLFFAVKRGYLDERERVREERHRYIITTMRSLPPEIVAQIKYLGYLERYYNAAGHSPVWQKSLFPGSKKRADRYAHFTTSDWHDLFRQHVARLLGRYTALSPTIANRVLACFVLGMTPSLIPPPRPSGSEVARVYRRLSLLHHPDRGGDPSTFIAIKRARDLLIVKG
jgi:hypothetical protein